MSKGMGWEARLQVWHRGYAQAGRGKVVKTNPPVKVGRNGKPCAWAGAGPVDFIGVIDNKAVFFDAKDTKSPRAWPLSQIAAHQAACLRHAEQGGARAFIALRHPSGMWVLPWSVLGPMYYDKTGPRSVVPEDIGIAMTADGWADVEA